ncbi:MAG: hypothetical protein M3367_06825 [Acidobacteriota bacterium]|nr:hypothetical protein [Acidobacteriota bacterium]
MEICESSAITKFITEFQATARQSARTIIMTRRRAAARRRWLSTENRV